MKKILCSLLLIFSLKSLAQQAPATNPYFVVLYTTGAAWDTTKEYHEQKYFNEHSVYLGKLRKDKTIVMGARYSDTGMIVITAKDEVEAKAIVNRDMAIQNNLFKTEVFLFEPFYAGCVSESE